MRLEKKKPDEIDKLEEDICEECCGRIGEIDELEIMEKYHR